MSTSATFQFCPLCYEEYAPASSPVILSACLHQSCRACLVKWIEKEESSGQARPPTCPFCRIDINEENVLAILGRSFQPRRGSSGAASGDDEIDELTLHWLNEHTALCEGCGSRIEKESGCDLVECLCGWRFCYRCGVPGGRCGCNPRHGFLDPLGHVDDAPIRDAGGRVEMGRCIARRKVRRERGLRRRERMREEEARWTHRAKNARVCTGNGRWLFSPRTNGGSFRMLAQQLGYERVRRMRLCARTTRFPRQPRANVDLSWLFPTQHRFEEEVEWRKQRSIRKKVQQQKRKEVSIRWNHSNKNASVCTSNGRWLFSCGEGAGCTRMLVQQLDYWEARKLRHETREQTAREQRIHCKYSSKNASACTSNGRWLFSCREGAGCTRMLMQQLGHSQVRKQRRQAKQQVRKEQRNRWRCSSESACICASNGGWLFSFKEDAACVRMLLHSKWACARGDMRRQKQGKHLVFDHLALLTG